jgi:hypothetical protein
MRVAICSELDQWNENVDEMIRLFQSAQDAGVWSRQEAERHGARLEALRVELNDDFNALFRLARTCRFTWLQRAKLPSVINE